MYVSSCSKCDTRKTRSHRGQWTASTRLHSLIIATSSKSVILRGFHFWWLGVAPHVGQSTGLANLIHFISDLLNVVEVDDNLADDLTVDLDVGALMLQALFYFGHELRGLLGIHTDGGLAGE